MKCSPYKVHIEVLLVSWTRNPPQPLANRSRILIKKKSTTNGFSPQETYVCLFEHLWNGFGLDNEALILKIHLILKNWSAVWFTRDLAERYWLNWNHFANSPSNVNFHRCWKRWKQIYPTSARLVPIVSLSSTLISLHSMYSLEMPKTATFLKRHIATDCWAAILWILLWVLLGCNIVNIVGLQYCDYCWAAQFQVKLSWVKSRY